MRDRYSRQTLFEGIGPEGQARLARSTVAVIGCGALGAIQIESLARAGVGSLRLIDRDFVDESNLQRQIMFEEQDAIDRLPKAMACQRRVARINADVHVEAIVGDLHFANIEEHVGGVDLVMDGTDNFETRFLINDVCIKRGIPWIYGAAVGAYGLTMNVIPGRTPCLRCVLDSPPPPGTSPTCDTAGVILPIISIVASVQVTEALKLLAGRLDDLRDTLLQIDVWRGTFHQVKLSGLREQANCPACRHGRFEYLEAEQRQLAVGLCGRNAVHIAQPGVFKLDLQALADKLHALGEVTLKPYLLTFRVGDQELNLFEDGHCIIKGTTDVGFARGLYAKYVGN
ncbi:MAG: ThiF family adenylyltransferase [Acidobacteria bacterium]|nr:ThiF family adenylyltransferase [Acidobacteriota bacterium]